MNRSQLEHIIRAAAANADTLDIVVIGSQAVLGSFPDAPVELLGSMEVDVFPRERPADSILIDGAIGEKSVFHPTFGYYAHGVGEDTATLPRDWKKRLTPLVNENTRGTTGWCLEVHDLAVSKLAAGRQKDLEYVAALLRHGLVRRDIIRERISLTHFGSAEADALAVARLERMSAQSPP